MEQTQFYDGINHRTRKDRTEEHITIEVNFDDLPKGSVTFVKPTRPEISQYRADRGISRIASGVDRFYEKLMVKQTAEVDEDNDFQRKRFRTVALDIYFQKVWMEMVD